MLLSHRYAYNITIMIVAALTGNYGMGKSSVLSLFASFGAAVLDCDKVVEQLLEEQPVIDSIEQMIGGVLEGSGRLDKKAIARRVFHDPVLRNRLEELIHPLVFEKIDAFIKDMKDLRQVAVVEVPLLFEAGRSGRFDKTITVYTTKDEALKRLIKSGIAPREAEARLAVQMPIEDKIRLSDYSIDNTGTKEETSKQVEAVYRALLGQGS
ncbi:MAG: dephospho-CoA kinase [Nitrospirae bacterium]|nr:dephospho-CoA kinase [Nitrospirota bacterium]